MKLMKSSLLKGSKGEETGSGLPKHVCDICNEGFQDQFKFFSHLRAHYEGGGGEQGEGTRTEERQCDRDHDPVSSVGFGNSSGGAPPTNFSSNITSDSSAEKDKESSTFVLQDSPRVTIILQHEVGSGGDLIGHASVEEGAFERERLNSGLTCTTCNRQFRKERTLQAHFLNCQDEQEDAAPKVDKKKSKDKDQRRAVEEVEGIKVEAPGSSFLSSEVEETDSFGVEEDEEDDDRFADDEILGGDENACPSCDKAFPSLEKLESHITQLHPELEDEMSAVAARPKPPKKKKSNSNKKREVLKCDVCERIFNHRNSMVYHMRSHTGERPHQCEQCGKSFFATSALKVHMRLHSGEKPYKCEHCGRSFRQWGDLKYHVISIHSDIRQYQCEFCGKDFARKYSLIVHRRIHTGERNYQCDFCDKSFRAASYLQNHRRIHTGEKPHACTICGKPFRVRSDMKRHMSSHTRDNPNITAAHNSARASQNSNTTTLSLRTGQSMSEAPSIPTSAAQSGSSMMNAVAISQQISVKGIGINPDAQGVASPRQVVHYQVQSVVDESNELISGDITEQPPISIALSQNQSTSSDATGGMSVATVATLQDLPEGVIYHQNRDGQVETVTLDSLREGPGGTLYVYTPVLWNNIN